MFELESRRHADIIRIGPELDVRNARQASESLKKIIAEGKVRLVADLSQLEFIDSSGLGSLVSIMKIARKTGGDLRLCGLNPAVRSIFELTRLSRIFHSYESVEDAVKSFSS